MFVVKQQIFPVALLSLTSPYSREVLIYCTLLFPLSLRFSECVPQMRLRASSGNERSIAKWGNRCSESLSELPLRLPATLHTAVLRRSHWAEDWSNTSYGIKVQTTVDPEGDSIWSHIYILYRMRVVLQRLDRFPGREWKLFSAAGFFMSVVCIKKHCPGACMCVCAWNTSCVGLHALPPSSLGNTNSFLDPPQRAPAAAAINHSQMVWLELWHSESCSRSSAAFPPCFW